jgi:hypothetical protein
MIHCAICNKLKQDGDTWFLGEAISDRVVILSWIASIGRLHGIYHICEPCVGRFAARWAKAAMPDTSPHGGATHKQTEMDKLRERARTNHNSGGPEQHAMHPAFLIDSNKRHSKSRATDRYHGRQLYRYRASSQAAKNRRNAI